MTTKKKKSRTWQYIGTILMIIVLAGLWFGYNYFFKNNVRLSTDKEYLYIPSNATFDDVVSHLESEKIVKDINAFKWLAKQVDYENNVKPGRYKLRKRMSNKELVFLLRSGKQEAVNLVIRDLMSKEALAGQLGKKFETDSLEFLNILNNSAYFKKYSLNAKTSIAFFIPNTYEFYWNTPVDKIFEKLEKEYRKFWNATRLEQCANIGLNLGEVTTLASIVDKETTHKDEMGRIAGVYMNRLNKDMMLQADPTVKFAIGNMTAQRVTYEMLRYDSPYNTYKYKGLPPGPICLPSSAAIDAVLNYERNKYLFFCASETFDGTHNFAVTDKEHLVNAKKYQAELNRRGIK